GGAEEGGSEESAGEETSEEASKEESGAMSATVWKQVDDYIVDSMVGVDAALKDTQAAAKAAGLPHIAVSAAQGKMLQLMAKSIGAKRILEVGTLGGYSAIWLARALPDDGKLITLEIDPKHAEVARKNIANAGL